MFLLRFHYDLATLDFYDFLMGLFFGYDLVMVFLCPWRFPISHMQGLLGCKIWALSLICVQ